jgi:hypothetical protein
MPITVKKSRRIRRMGHVACVGEMRYAYRTAVGKSEEWRPLGTDARIILKCTLKKLIKYHGLDLAGSR